jgi:quercetin dioxygenase-like cupin family protein/iron-sulfur cluster repair protein YtfE (RIC family)
MAIRLSRPLVGRAAELAEFSPEGFGRRVLSETDHFRVVVAALEDGQEIPLHAPPLDMVMTIVEGIGQVMAGDQVHPVRAGDVVIVPAGQTRGLRATGGRLVAVNVVSPPPGPGDHAGSATAWPVEEDAPDVGALILEEHAGLFPHLDHLGSLASEVTTLGEGELRTRLREVLAFLRDGLLPHAREEEVSVYPAAEKVLRAVGGATRTMSIDHRFVGEMVEELSGFSDGLLSSASKERIRRLLYGLQALLQVHFTKENEVYVPLLNRLSPSERHQLYDRLSGGDGGHQNHHKES